MIGHNVIQKAQLSSGMALCHSLFTIIKYWVRNFTPSHIRAKRFTYSNADAYPGCDPYAYADRGCYRQTLCFKLKRKFNFAVR